MARIICSWLNYKKFKCLPYNRYLNHALYSFYFKFSKFKKKIHNEILYKNFIKKLLFFSVMKWWNSILWVLMVFHPFIRKQTFSLFNIVRTTGWGTKTDPTFTTVGGQFRFPTLYIWIRTLFKSGFKQRFYGNDRYFISVL